MLRDSCKLFCICLAALLMWSCQDKCTQIVRYRGTEPVITYLKDLRKGISSGAVRSLENPGKIYIKDKYLFINELKKGIHVIDNSNASSPKFVAFINIPGNIDMAVKDDIMYADSYTDVVSLEISVPTAVKEIGRQERVFLNGQADGLGWYVNEQDKTIVDYKWVTKTDTVEVYCEGGVYPATYFGGAFYDLASFSRSGATQSSGGGSSKPAAGTTGTAGSMARFGLDGNYLYAVSNSELIPFDITNPQSPLLLSRINLNWGIETIFPYKNKLFIGSTTGMHIFDNSVPAKPRLLSTYSHFKACDPVVVYDNYAYVTLRANNGFGRCGVVNDNQLDLIDINDPETPKLVKSFKMDSPAGLGIDFPSLFVCEGSKGIKAFNITNPINLGDNKIGEYKGFDAYDLIPLDKKLLVIGKDGLYQYDYSDPKNLRLLSTIKAIKP